MISSGRSFKIFSLAVDQFFTELVEPAAHARVGAHRAGLDDDAADDVGVDRPRGDDASAGGLLDLLDHLGSLLVGELDRGGQLELEDALLAREQPSEFLVHLLDLRDPPLLGEEMDEVQEDLVPAGEEVVERGELRLRLHLGIAEKAAQLLRFRKRRGERVELLAHTWENVLLLGCLEESLGIDAVGNSQLFS